MNGIGTLAVCIAFDGVQFFFSFTAVYCFTAFETFPLFLNVAAIRGRIFAQDAWMHACMCFFFIIIYHRFFSFYVYAKWVLIVFFSSFSLLLLVLCVLNSFGGVVLFSSFVVHSFVRSSFFCEITVFVDFEFDSSLAVIGADHSLDMTNIEIICFHFCSHVKKM